jgi:hypothetical protein
MADKIGVVLDQIEETRQRHLDELAEINARGDTYEFLVAVRRCPAVPLSMKVKVATELLPYERPKLGVTVNVQAGGDFAERLERAIARSNGNSAKLTSGKVIEHDASELKEGLLAAPPHHILRRI